MAHILRLVLVKQTQNSWSSDATLGRFISKFLVELFMLRHCITMLNKESNTALNLGSLGLECCSCVRLMKFLIPMSACP